MKRNILVFPCGTEIGLEVYRSLSLSTHFTIFGGSSIQDHGKFVYKNYIDGIPYVDEPGFIDRLNEVIERNNIEFIIPTHDSVLLKLAQAQANGNLKCSVVTSPVETCEIARSKLKTLEFFEGSIPTPKIYKSPEDVTETDLPVFLKPDVGQGSKGTYLAKTIEDIVFYTKKDPTLLILEYLSGKEYTVDCFTSKDGQLLFSEGRERIRVSGGISVASATVGNERFTRLAETINQKIRLRGTWFFQLKENTKGELALMEIAPRVAGTMGLVRCKGINLPLLSLFDAMGQDVDIIENKYDMVVDRALQSLYQHDINYSHAYLDLDDLIIFEEQVNPSVMAFVFQCINKGVKVHLLTRHGSDLDQTLRQYKLAGIFDEILWVKDDNEKYKLITEKDAIFIDDSFAERKRVREALDIPVFDSHMIESLMEKS